MDKLIKIILALILPPVAAYLQVGATKHFILNLVLSLIFLVPGVIHALWLVLTEQKA